MVCSEIRWASDSRWIPRAPNAIETVNSLEEKRGQGDTGHRGGEGGIVGGLGEGGPNS